jgi:hypothetical protein
MIEQGRDPRGAQIDRDAGPKHEGFGVIHLDSSAADKLYYEGSKRRTFLKGAENLFQVFGCHIYIIPQLWRDCIMEFCMASD